MLPAKDHRKPKPAIHRRLLGCECPSALSFLLAKSSHLGQRKRIATALPRAENRFRNSPMNAFASKSAGASAPVLIEPRSPTTARQCREIFRTTVRLPKYAHVVRFAEEAALHSTGLPNQPPSQPDSDTIVVPALVSVFDSEVTSLECVTTRPLGYVLPSSSHTLPMKRNNS